MGAPWQREPPAAQSLAAASVKQEGLRFLEQELETITIPDLSGREGPFYYNISE